MGRAARWDGGVLVVVPCLDEAEHIARTVEAILREVPGHSVVVVDGGSTDGTRQILAALSQEHGIHVLDNGARIQAAAVNLAVAELGAGYDYLLRVDAHGEIPRGFVTALLEVGRRTGADSVVVSMDTLGGSGRFQAAVAAAQGSAAGNGGSAHRNPVFSGRWVDHGHHALFTMDAFRAVGGYDEAFSHNEDAEFDIRFRAAGYRIWLASEVRVGYYPRSTPAGLAAQYYAFGRGRARTVRKHRIAAPRQLLVAWVVPALVVALGAPARPVLGLPAFAWASLCMLAGLSYGLRTRRVSGLAAGPVVALMHVAWSAGFWRGLLQRSSGTTARGPARRLRTAAPALALRANVVLRKAVLGAPRVNRAVFLAQNILTLARVTVTGSAIAVPHRRRGPRRTLAAVVRVRDEGRFLTEWLCHHLALGFEHFYVYDNGSTDHTRAVLSPFVQAGIVTYIHWPVSPVTPSCERHFFARHAADDAWVAFFDADEFLSISPDRPLRDVLENHDAPALAVNWRYFGSSWHASTPDGLVTREFDLADENLNDQIKVIVRPREVLALRNPHNFYYRRGRLAKTVDGVRAYGTFASARTGCSLELRHYVYRGDEDFVRKSARSYSATAGHHLRGRRPQDRILEYTRHNDVRRAFPVQDLARVEQLIARVAAESMRLEPVGAAHSD